MTFFDDVTKLKQYIAKYLTIHNNPYDTSEHNAFAKKLGVVNPTLEKAAPSPPITTIKNSVGKNAANNYNEVKLVQRLLGIKEDGFSGPNTIKAIVEFQRNLGSKNPDGRVDPNGFTWGHLIGSTPNTENNSTTTETINKSVGKNGVNNVADVKIIQQLLNGKGASLNIDGDPGPATIKAIKVFQVSLGTKNPDGRIDPNGFTWEKLTQKSDILTDSSKEDNSTKKPPSKDSSKSTPSNITDSVGKGGINNVEDVKLVQQLLQKKDFPINVDGKAGPNTIEVIKNFQGFIGLPTPDGRIDPDGFTWKKLNLEGSPHTFLDKTVISTGNEPIPEELSVTSKIKKSVGRNGVNLPEDVILVQKLLLKFNYTLEETPTVTISFLSAIKRFQIEFLGSKKPDSRIDPNGKTWNTLLGIGRIRRGIYDVAAKYGIEPAVILAIQSVESGGNGFLSDGRPKILFEGHIFWRELKKIGKDPVALQAGNENILYPRWVKTNYKYNEKEYDRLALAQKIDKSAALKSASWGEFQIMGFNYASTGYSDVESFVESMYRPGVNQLSSLMGFLKTNNLLKHVQGASKNWAALAKGYNGPSYAKNKYDVKLASAYNRFSKIMI
mgnify:CR=1 FL=1